MKNFSIAELERFSDIKAHTLRTWEHRYGVPRPERTQSNSRFYSMDQLKQVLNLAVLNKVGYRISHLSALPDLQIEEALLQLRDNDDRQRLAIANLLMAMYAIDIEAFESLLDDCFLSWPVNECLEKIIYPFLFKTRLLWKGNRLTEEHLVVTAIRKKLMWGIERAAVEKQAGKTVLLFLADTKQLDLALLYTNYYLKSKGVRVIYLGNDVSMDNLSMIFDAMQPDHLYTYCSVKPKLPWGDLSDLVRSKLPRSKLVITTPDTTRQQADHDNILWMHHSDALSYLTGKS